MTENMDKYLNYAAKEWMEENKLAVEHGVRNEVTESLITGLKKLLEDHYIDAISKIAIPIVYFIAIGTYFVIEFTHH